MAVTCGYRQTSEHVRRRIASRLRTLAEKPKQVSKEWLETHYISKHLDCVQIGALIKRDPKTVWSWLRHYGIQTRSRGHDTSRLSRGRPSGFKHTNETKQKLRAISLADGRVPFNPDIGPPYRGKHGADTPNWKGGITPERQAFYASEEWRAAVKRVWKRADACCERCGIHHNTTETRGTFHVHHIISFMVRDRRASVGNLALLCNTCHMFVHSKRNTKREFLPEKANVSA